jgi:hypothetical protein
MLACIGSERPIRIIGGFFAANLSLNYVAILSLISPLFHRC